MSIITDAPGADLPYDVRRSVQVFRTIFGDKKPFTLDIGCNGFMGKKASLFKSLCSSLVGVDITADFPPGLLKTIARAETLPFSDNSFEAVTNFHVIEHIEEREAVIEGIYRTLKPGGWLLLVTPNRTRMTAIYSKVLRLLHPKNRYRYPLNPDHVLEFSKGDLQVLFGRSQFPSWSIEPMFLGLVSGFLGIKRGIGIEKVPRLLSSLCSQWLIIAQKPTEF